MKTFSVYHKINNDWKPVPFATGNLSYCNGFVDAMDSLYPSRPHCIREEDEMGSRVVRETNGHAAIHTN